jgi:hypothetical protein
MDIRDIDLRVCEYFFLPLNPLCVTTTSTTTAIPATTTTSTTSTSSTTSTTSTTTTICDCYEGYTPTTDDRCVKTTTVAATPPSDLQLSVAKTYSQYSNYGSILFDTGYNLNGTTSAPYQIITTSFWKNIPNNTTDGPLNRCGLWAAIVYSNQDVGFTYCLDVIVDKTYYVAVGCDNYAIIRVDGTTVVSQNVAALTAQFGASTSVTFKYWFIYPIYLTVGAHVIEMIGHNIDMIAALGAEIYDATKNEIITATDYTTFSNAHILFSTKDMIGEYIEIGTGGLGYTCPTGYSLIMCQGDPHCINIDYIDCGETPPLTTTTTTTEMENP